MNLLVIACRNIRRTRHRTWVTVGAMAFAGFMMIFYASLLEGFIRTSERNAVTMEIGEFQAHMPGYRNDPDLYRRITGSGAILHRLEQEGFVGAPRLYGFGLAAAGSAAAGISMRGVDVGLESLVTRIHHHLLAGSWLAGDEPRGVVLGRKLARTLGVGIGDEVLVVSQAADGSTANDLYFVRGILKSVGSGVDSAGFFMTAAAFRELLVLPQGVHEIVISRRNQEAGLAESTRRLREIVPGLEVRNWRELNPVLAKLIDTSQFSLILMLLIIYTAVAIVVLNAMLMSVFERLPEFGIMKALGVSPWRLFALIVSETFLQVSLAAAGALLAGLPLSLYYQSHPLDFSAFTSSSSIAGVAFDPHWYCLVTVETVLTPVLFLYLIAGVAILYPAVKAAMIRPVEAIHYR